MRLCILFFGLSGALACARSPVVFYTPDGDLELAPEPETFLGIEQVEDPAEPAEYAQLPEPVHVPEDQWTRARPDDPLGSVVYTEPGELPRLELAGGATLPLRSTSVRAHLRGPVAEVIVTQKFVNDRSNPLEAIYTFPLPENSAVDRMRMVLGDRTIEAEIRERNQARQVYQAAAAAGHTAALLEQERPNIFTQSVANIPPGQTIDVEIHYLQTLTYDAGEYEFVFPTVVGPRYIPGAKISREGSGRTGTGRVGDTTRVPDASRITPPILGRGERTGHDLAIEVIAEAGNPISHWAVPQHEVHAQTTAERLIIKLADRDKIPNRDFVLRYRSAGPRPTARMFVQPRQGAPGGHFMLVAEPPRLDVEDLVGRRELIFVVDISGSMHGTPLALAKAAMRESLAHLRPVDTFDVFTFSGGTGRLFQSPRPATATNVQHAVQFVDGLVAAGGTEMSGAVDGALGSPVPEDRHRYVFFLTDGNTGEEAEIARRARLLVDRQRQLGRRARVFGVGIGSSPNSHLIAELSQAGAGVPLSIHTPTEISRAVRTFERIIDAPVVTDLALEWGGLTVDSVYPESRDLFASRPLVIHGHYTGAVPSRPSVTLHGTVGPPAGPEGREAKSVTFPVELALAGERTEVLASLWARARVDDLDMRRITADSHAAGEAAAKQILATGLEYHLVTAYTSLVAVDSSRVHTGPRSTVVQPVEVPHDVSGAHAYQFDVVHNTAYGTVGSKIQMDELRNVPVGGTSRDFTAVVDMAPTATRDYAGIRLSGATMPITGPPDHTLEGVLRSGLLRDGVPPSYRGSSVPTARTRITGLTAPTPESAGLLRSHLLVDRRLLDACFLAVDSEHLRLFRKLRLVIRVLAGHRLHSIAFHTDKPLAESTRTCVGELVESTLRNAATPPGDVVLDLRVRTRL